MSDKPTPSSHWNYRLVRLNEEDVEICEVYYTGDGVPTGYVARSAGGTTREEIETALQLMITALDKSVLVAKRVQGSVTELVDTDELLEGLEPGALDPPDRPTTQ